MVAKPRLIGWSKWEWHPTHTFFLLLMVPMTRLIYPVFWARMSTATTSYSAAARCGIATEISGSWAGRMCWLTDCSAHGVDC